MTPCRRGALCLATLMVMSSGALGTVPAPGAPPPPASAAAPSWQTCQETFPAGAERPKVKEGFPSKGTSGHVLLLDLVIEHRKGETVLPGGLGAGSDRRADEAKALAQAGFFLPDPAGGAEPKLETKEGGAAATSHLALPLVALPRKPGRNELVLPPLPIAIARASGEVRTLCTSPHAIVVEDPIANTPDAKPKGNPKPLRQLEEWTAAKHAAIGAAIALVVGGLLAWLIRYWMKRPKPARPPPPPRPPWEVALEELFDVKVADLVAQGRYAEHFDRVSDAVRRYLGARYGFDGLETTTREAMAALGRVSPRVSVLTETQLFLEDADLVKFAKRTPAEAECRAVLMQAEDIVRRTMPAPEIAPPAAPPAGPPPPVRVAAPPSYRRRSQ